MVLIGGIGFGIFLWKNWTGNEVSEMETHTHDCEIRWGVHKKCNCVHGKLAILLADRDALMRYVRAKEKLDKIPAYKSIEIEDMLPKLEAAYKAFSQDLKDEIQNQDQAARSNTG